MANEMVERMGEGTKKRRITFEVDTAQLFDMLHKMGGETGDIGNRVIGVMLADAGFFEALGMAVYGIAVVGEKK